MAPNIIQFTQLGKFGRFGNQMFQYAFARAYAEKYGCILEIPTWVGEKIFKNVSHSPISKHCPRTSLDEIKWGQVNIDLFGYFQKKEFIDILSEAKLREWFVLQDKWLEFFINLKTYAIAHLRRGDYQTLYADVFCIISKESYQRAFKKFGVQEQSVYWRAEESQVKWRYIDDDILFLPDFFEMMNVQHLFRANSTFSFWAGFFNKNKVYSPVVGNKVGVNDVEFVEGNASSIVACNNDFIFGK